jgi:hypothetical protein
MTIRLDYALGGTSLYYTVYKITNKINGKSYIGKHQTADLNDGYMGSGKLIKAAIQKYGIENFEKEILHVFDNEDDMNKAESKLAVLGENSYNLCPGGHGGFGYINSSGLNGSHVGVSNRLKLHEDQEWHSWWSERQREGYAKSDHDSRIKKWKKTFEKNGALKPNHFKGKTHTDESKKKMSETKKAAGFQQGEKNSQWGKPRSEETKAKIRATMALKKLKSTPQGPTN